MKKIFRKSLLGNIIGFYEVHLAATTQTALNLFQQQRNHKAAHTPLVRRLPKTGRNDPCLCGSGLKFKRCHGKDQ